MHIKLGVAEPTSGQHPQLQARTAADKTVEKVSKYWVRPGTDWIRGNRRRDSFASAAATTNVRNQWVEMYPILFSLILWQKAKKILPTSTLQSIHKLDTSSPALKSVQSMLYRSKVVGRKNKVRQKS